MIRWPKGYDQDMHESVKDWTLQELKEDERRQHINCHCYEVELSAHFTGRSVNPEVYRICDEVLAKRGVKKHMITLNDNYAGLSPGAALAETPASP